MMKEQINIIYYFLSVRVIDTQEVICFKTEREPAAKLVTEVFCFCFIFNDYLFICEREGGKQAPR